MNRKWIALFLVVCLVALSGCGLPKFGEKQEATDNATSAESMQENLDSEPQEDDKSSQSVVSNENAEIFPIQFIGKTLNDAKLVYGSDFVIDGYAGSVAVYYTDVEIAFVLDSYDEKVTGKERIVGVIGYGDTPVYNRITGNLRLSQLHVLMDKQLSLGEPYCYYNEFEGLYKYNLHFFLDGYCFTYTWLDDPRSMKSLNVVVYEGEIIGATYF